jgi:hypothetical protein
VNHGESNNWEKAFAMMLVSGHESSASTSELSSLATCSRRMLLAFPDLSAEEVAEASKSKLNKSSK